MSWINTVLVAGAVCGVLAAGVTSSAFAAGDGHISDRLSLYAIGLQARDSHRSS